MPRADACDSNAQNKNLESECDLLRFLNVLHVSEKKRELCRSADNLVNVMWQERGSQSQNDIKKLKNIIN